MRRETDEKPQKIVVFATALTEKLIEKWSPSPGQQLLQSVFLIDNLPGILWGSWSCFLQFAKKGRIQGLSY
jgi:hypothetical protein